MNICQFEIKYDLEIDLCLPLLQSWMSIIVPPIRAIIPLTIKMIPTNIPKKASPISMPMCLRDCFRAVWLTIRADLIMFLVDILVDIDSGKEE